MSHDLSFLKPSPAMAVALAATLAACTGLAVAASSSSPVIRACANKKTGALRLASKCRHAERSVTWGVEGAKGLAGAPGGTGGVGNEGTPGKGGAPGTARAYAYTTGGSGTFEGAWTKNFTAISNIETGVYCLTPVAGIDPSTSPAVATVDFGSSEKAPRDFVEVRVRHVACGEGKYEIRTLQAPVSGGNLQEPVASDLVAFTVIVP